MRLFKPYHQVHLELFSTHKENPSQKYKVFMSMTLETPTLAANDKIVAVVVNSCRFDPPSPNNITGFSFLLGTNNFNVGSFPYLQINPRETEANVERVLNFHNELDFILFQSPWQNIPTAIMDS